MLKFLHKAGQLKGLEFTHWSKIWVCIKTKCYKIDK